MGPFATLFVGIALGFLFRHAAKSSAEEEAAALRFKAEDLERRLVLLEVEAAERVLGDTQPMPHDFTPTPVDWQFTGDHDKDPEAEANPFADLAIPDPPPADEPPAGPVNRIRQYWEDA